MRELRPYQLELIQSIKDTIRNGVRRMVVALPVGAGKTLCAATIASGALAKGNGVAFTCPRIDLIDQTVEEFSKEGITDIGVIQADHIMTDYSRMLQVCSLQTMERRGYFPKSKIVIFDEVHLLRGGMIKFMAEHPDAIFIGLSATPWTKGLGDHFETLIIGSTMKDLMTQGYLSQYRAFAPNVPDLKGITIDPLTGDYRTGKLSERMRGRQLVADIVKTWQSHPVRDRTLVFAVDRAHAKLLQARFQDTGIKVGYQDAFTPPMERRELKRSFQNRELPIIVSVETMIVGNDLDVRCISFCRPTKSEMLWVQALGRGMRPAAPGSDPKENLLLLDHSGNILDQNLGRPEDIEYDRLLKSTDDNAKRIVKEKEEFAKQCPKCSFMKPPRAKICPACGFESTLVSDIIEKDGVLEEITKDGMLLAPNKKSKQELWTLEQKKIFMSEVKALGIEKGRKPGWCAVVYKKKFGYWPEGIIPGVAPAKEAGPYVRSYCKSLDIAYFKSKAYKDRKNDGDVEKIT
jgi:DNA repair protein RadD